MIMFKKLQLPAALLISSAMVIGLSSGCASAKKEKLPASRTHNVSDDGFAAGAGRAPTPATSHSFAKLLVAQGRDRDALYVLERIVRERPKFISAYNEIAGVYVRADRIDDAVQAIQAGLKQAPQDAVLQNNLGMCHLLEAKYEQALAAFTRAAALMPTNPTFRANRAAALALLGRASDAEKEYRTVLGKTATQQNLTILGRVRSTKIDQTHGKELAAPTADAARTTTDARGVAVPPDQHLALDIKYSGG
jgi:tetratricopeptide (TPR) repeat protein